MKNGWLFFFFFTFIGTVHAEQNIRVLLKKNRSSILLKGIGINFERTPALRGLFSPKRASFVITTNWVDGLRVWKVKNVKTKKVKRFSGARLKIFGQSLQVNSRLVPSNIFLFAKEKNKFDIVTVLPLETYLAGVLPAETPASWPVETLKAQAIAARSYAAAVIKERQGNYYHIESTINDQVYNYENLMSFSPRLKRRVQKVLKETRGIYLAKKKKTQVYKSFYHADCGGHTEEPYLVWGDTRAVNGTVIDKFCPNSPHGQWEEKIPVSDLSQRLKDFFELPEEALFQSLRVSQRSHSGRVLLLTADFARGQYLISAQNLRQIMGFKKIKSTKFKFSWKNKWLIFKGRGFGHGVGLCQWGAKHMASRGKDYKTILKHYYPKTRLVKFKPKSDQKKTKETF